MPTHLESVNCGNCGAPLRIPESAQFVTCNHCQSSLAVRRMHSITLTEKLERTTERLDQTERRLAELVYQNELSEEHRRWEREERGLTTSDPHGNRRKPSMLGGIVLIVMGVFMAVIASNHRFQWFSLILLGSGIYGFFNQMARVNRYNRAYRRHTQRLREISDRHHESHGEGIHSEYTQQLQSAPTPQKYLRRLGRFD